MIRNHVGYARAGSNPTAHDLDFFYLLFIILWAWMSGSMTRKRTRLEISNPTAQNFDLLYFLIIGRAGVVIGQD